MDFGEYNRLPANLPSMFVQMLRTVPNNPGQCWVSTTCFQPQHLLERWIFPQLEALSDNLAVFLNTTVANVTFASQKPQEVDQKQPRSLTSLTVVQRSARQHKPGPGGDVWGRLLSADISDWCVQGLYVAGSSVCDRVSYESPVSCCVCHNSQVLPEKQFSLHQTLDPSHRISFAAPCSRGCD